MGRPRRATRQGSAGELREGRVVSLLRVRADEVAAADSAPPGMTTGKLVRVAGDGHVWIELSGERSLTLRCLNAASLTAAELDLQVVVWRVPKGDSIALAKVAPAGDVDAALPDASEAPREAMIDGRRVVLEAADEIVLRCGRASIVLRRNGRVQIKGAYVETSSEGVNRIKGGTVQIN